MRGGTLRAEADIYAAPCGFQPVRPSPEEWVCGASSGEPGFLLRRLRKSGDLAATFSLNLVGISHHVGYDGSPCPAGGSDEPRGGDFWGLLLASIDAGDRLRVIYGNEPDARGGYRFSLQVLQTLRAPDADRAAKKVRRRWREFTSMLSAAALGYSFAPAPEAEVSSGMRRYAWRAKLQPPGLLLDPTVRRRIGFTPGGDYDKRPGPVRRPAVIALPWPVRNVASPDYDGLARCVAGCAAALKVSLIFEPFRLPDDDAMLLRDAADALQSDTARLIKHGAVQAEDFLDLEVCDSLRGLVAQWAEKPRVYRVSCLVSAAAPPPAPLVEYLRRKVFGCDTGIARRAKLTSNGRGWLDLRGVVQRASLVPAPFPSIRFLNEIGVSHFFADAPAALSSDGILLGHAGLQECRKEVRFTRDDRACHSYVVGATGSGKSTLLYNMITQDVRNGEGVALIDPHGDLYQAVLSAVPPHRAEDVVLIDCCDFERAVGLNFLESRRPYRHQQMNFISNEVIKIFDQLYDLEKTGGPVFEQYMRNALLLAMDDEERQATLLDIPVLFEDPDYRRALVKRCRNPIIADFWSKQAERAGGEMSLHNIAPYITSKLNQFTSNALLRPIIGQASSTFDFRELLDRRRILLVNLAKGVLGEMDTRLLGMLIMGKLFCAALGRTDASPASRHPFYVYVDEFQNFTTETVASLLSEARKYGLHLTLANQNLAQLSASHSRRNVLDAVLGNCGSLFLFRQGAIDAQFMEAYTVPYFKAQDLQELPAYHVAARLLCQRRPLRPFVFQTLPPSNANEPTADLDSLINNSKRKYARPTSEVEHAIFDRRRGGDSV